MKKDLIFTPILLVIGILLFLLRATGMTAHIVVSVIGVLVLIAYIFIGQGVQVPDYLPSVAWYKVIPYLSVLILAIAGVNVLVVLLIGILLACGIGILTGCFTLIGCMGAMGEGIMGMSELIIVTLLAGGMLRHRISYSRSDHAHSRQTRRQTDDCLVGHIGRLVYSQQYDCVGDCRSDGT